MDDSRTKEIGLGAGMGIVFGAVFGSIAMGLVIGAAIGFWAGPSITKMLGRGAE